MTLESRENDLVQLKIYTEGIDKELTMILQNLQWDRSNLNKAISMLTCKLDTNHSIPSRDRKKHEEKCFLKQQGYFNDNTLLPDPMDTGASTLVNLNSEDISKIIENASKSNPLFKKVFEIVMALKRCNNMLFIMRCRGPEPLSLACLQAVYTADERRAIHDAVVSAVPSCHDLTDLALLSSKGDEQKTSKTKSRVEILAELRDMRRRRTKYRVAAKTRNYSDVLRDVIKTQMEFYNDLQSDAAAMSSKENTEINKHVDNNKHNDHSNAIQTIRADYSNEYNRHSVNDDYKNRYSRDFRWGSEYKKDGSMDRVHSRHKERSREIRIEDKRDKYVTKREDETETPKNSKYIEDRTPGADRYRYKESHKDRRYDDGGKRNSKQGSFHRKDADDPKDGFRKHYREKAYKNEERSKYDQYKSRDSKRHYEDISNREYKKEGMTSHGHKKYKRYDD